MQALESGARCKQASKRASGRTTTHEEVAVGASVGVVHDAVVRDVASEVTGEAGRVSVATIEMPSMFFGFDLLVCLIAGSGPDRASALGVTLLAI